MTECCISVAAALAHSCGMGHSHDLCGWDQAEAADWRRASPRARPLKAAVYGSEANNRVAALRARSISPGPRNSHCHHAHASEECSFNPRTNARRPATPPPLRGRGASSSKSAAADRYAAL